MTDVSHEPDWTVLLIGGASGVGKTSISYRLAQHYAVGITEIDDFQVILEGMTSSEQYPALHHWRLHGEEMLRLDDEGKLCVMLDYSAVMNEALTLVVANHIESRTPIILEGDFILPALAIQASYNDVPAAGQVRAVFLYEPEEEQIRRNYTFRDGIEQPERARASWHHSEWLRQEAERLGVPSIPARPWETVLDRVRRSVVA